MPIQNFFRELGRVCLWYHIGMHFHNTSFLQNPACRKPHETFYRPDFAILVCIPKFSQSLNFAGCLACENKNYHG